MHTGFSRYILIALLLAGVFFTGFTAGKNSIPSADLVQGVENKSEGQSEKVDFSMFWRVWNALQQEYIDAEELEAEKLVDGAIKGMVRSVDDSYTRYLDPQASKNFEDTISGSFEGIGARIGIREDQLTIISPLEDTPANRAGVKAGDQVIRIDGTSTSGMSLEEAVSRIKGERGTEVVLTVAREELEETKKITITRDKIDIPVVRWESRKEGAYVRLFTFTEDVAGKFRNVANQVLKSGHDTMVLDLRNNAGGVLRGAINVAGWFVPEGKTVVQEKRDAKQVEHSSPGPGSFSDFKVVVLINEGSASASEILAGALQEQIGARLVGVQTFGKGSVQTLRKFQDSSTLKVTVARWLTPEGNLIEEEGIAPDVKVEMDPDQIDTEQDAQLQKAFEVLGNN